MEESYFVDKFLYGKDIHSYKNAENKSFSLDNLSPSDFDKKKENIDFYSSISSIVNNICKNLPQTSILKKSESLPVQSKPYLLSGDTENNEKEFSNFLFIEFLKHSFYKVEEKTQSLNFINYVDNKRKERELNRNQLIDYVKRRGWKKASLNKWIKEDVVEEFFPYFDICQIIKKQHLSNDFIKNFSNEINLKCGRDIFRNFKWHLFMVFIKLKTEEIEYGKKGILYAHPSFIERFKNEIYFYKNDFFDQKFIFDLKNKEGKDGYLVHEGSFGKIDLYSSTFVSHKKIIYCSDIWRDIDVKKIIPLREDEYCSFFDLMINFDYIELFDINSLLNYKLDYEQ